MPIKLIDLFWMSNKTKIFLSKDHLWRQIGQVQDNLAKSHKEAINITLHQSKDLRVIIVKKIKNNP